MTRKLLSFAIRLFSIELVVIQERLGCARARQAASCWAEIFRTVHSTINSRIALLEALALEQDCPRIGMSPSPGILLVMLVTRLSIRPAMTKLWPSCNSNSVSARRVLSAGISEAGNLSARWRSPAC